MLRPYPTVTLQAAQCVSVPRGAQIDVRFANRDQGSLAVVVAPVLRFAGRPSGLPLSHACAAVGVV